VSHQRRKEKRALNCTSSRAAFTIQAAGQPLRPIRDAQSQAAGENPGNGLLRNRSIGAGSSAQRAQVKRQSSDWRPRLALAA